MTRGGNDAPVLFLGRGGAIDGQQRQLSYLAKGLAREGTAVSVVLDGASALESDLAAAGIACRVSRQSPWRALGHLVDRYRDAFHLWRLAKGGGIRLVHAHDVWRAEYARFVAKRLGVPYVVHVRGPMSAHDIRKHRLRLADAVIAIAQRYVDDVIAAGVPAARVALIDDAVDTGRFSPAHADRDIIARTFFVEGRPLVGLVGRISAFKRVEEFLEMVALIPATAAPAARFVVIGEWEDAAYRAQIETAMERLQLRDRVRFLGRVDSEAMPAMLSGLDLLVTLSGGSIMFEAMAMGTPVLSIRADGRHSQHTRHDETAWCVTSDALTDGAAALSRLLEDQALRHRVGEAGREWVARKLSIDRLIGETRAVYAQAAGGRP